MRPLRFTTAVPDVFIGEEYRHNGPGVEPEFG